jgi:hypothetical protein
MPELQTKKYHLFLHMADLVGYQKYLFLRPHVCVCVFCSLVELARFSTLAFRFC